MWFGNEPKTAEGGMQHDFGESGPKSEILSFAHARNDLGSSFRGHLGYPPINHLAEDPERPPRHTVVESKEPFIPSLGALVDPFLFVEGWQCGLSGCREARSLQSRRCDRNALGYAAQQCTEKPQQIRY
jgi:hypothetical protein